MVQRALDGGHTVSYMWVIRTRIGLIVPITPLPKGPRYRYGAYFPKS